MMMLKFNNHRRQIMNLSHKSSINHIPAIFKHVDFEPFTINMDIGGGKYDTGTEYLENKKVQNVLYDPYNRTDEHNNNCLEFLKFHKAHTITISNVLNVLENEEEMTKVLEFAKTYLRENGKIYINVYEGNGTSIPKTSKLGVQQQNKKTAEYTDLIKKSYSKVNIKKKKSFNFFEVEG